MTTYAVLLRGINVGGKNRVPMAELRACLEKRGYLRVSTLIASGNVVLGSDKLPEAIRTDIEAVLPRTFELDSELVRVLVLPHHDLAAIVAGKPKGFGERPELYHSDAIFLMDITADEAITAFSPRAGVDTVWLGDGVIYSQRLSAERTKSRLNRIVGTPLYQNMTIRNWNTTTKLLGMMDASKRSK